MIQFNADVEARRYAARTADLGSDTAEEPREWQPRQVHWCRCGHWRGVHIDGGTCEPARRLCDCSTFRPDRSIT